MAINPARLRQLHSSLASIMVLPLLLSLTTGSLYQFSLLSGRSADFAWLLEVHKGHFGQLNLESIYPFLNALGLLTMIITGIGMWLGVRRRRSRS